MRGPEWDERSPSLSLPSATALSSSWDPEIAERYGAVCAYEARREGVDVVLGPTINLHRSPLGGRHFEAFSEDPVLTADLAAAYVHGVQKNLPWRGKAAALVATYFGGQEYGNAIADVLTGVREPGGRLPTTWPATQEDVPVIDVTPRDGALRYDEGIHIGYRA